MTTKVLSGERPERPRDPTLTDGLWDMTQRCLDQDPRRRPEITEVVCELSRLLVTRQDHTDAADITRAGDIALGGTKQWEPPYHVSSTAIPFQDTPAGSKGTRSPIFAWRLRRRHKLKTSIESLPASDRVCDIKSEESSHRLRRIKLGDLTVPMGVQFTPSDFRGSLRRAGLWLLTCGASFAQNHRNCHSEKQGTMSA